MPTPTATPPESLGQLAARVGGFAGAAFVEGSHEEIFRTVLVREFNSTTAGLYWSSTQPRREEYDFSGPDAALAVAEASGLRVRGHPLVWGRLALPDYVNAITDADDLRALMTAHLRTIVERYRGRTAQYDVVNEPLTLWARLASPTRGSSTTSS